MAKQNSSSSFKKNVFLSILVQILSLMVSFVLNLIVPKYIPELQYSYWQVYVLYVGYVGILHFGLLDGIVLRYSQYDYDELDKPRIRSQFIVLLVINSFFSFITLLLSLLLAKGAMLHVFIYVAIGIITKNVFTYTSYTFQITNRISKYAILIIAQKLFYGIMTLALLLFRVKNFYLFCIADLCGDVFSCLIGYCFNRELYFGKTLSLKGTCLELLLNISSGIMLLIANWSSMLLVGGAKMIIQWHWDELTFGKVSFSFSLSNLFLTFVTAISVVLFPSLKRMDKDRLPQLYASIRNAVSPLLFFAMLLYYPGCVILNIWMPKYHESLTYLGILMPIIIYASKVSLLTNNYLKAYRKERTMLAINLIFVVIAVCSFVVSAYVLNNLTMLLVMIVMAIMMRSVVSEIVVMKLIQLRLYKDFFIEGVMTIAFIMCANMLNFWIGFTLYLVFLIGYFIIYRKNLISYFGKLRRKA